MIRITSSHYESDNGIYGCATSEYRVVQTLHFPSVFNSEVPLWRRDNKFAAMTMLSHDNGALLTTYGPQYNSRPRRIVIPFESLDKVILALLMIRESKRAREYFQRIRNDR